MRTFLLIKKDDEGKRYISGVVRSAWYPSADALKVYQVKEIPTVSDAGPRSACCIYID